MSKAVRKSSRAAPPAAGANAAWLAQTAALRDAQAILTRIKGLPAEDRRAAIDRAFLDGELPLDLALNAALAAQVVIPFHLAGALMAAIRAYQTGKVDDLAAELKVYRRAKYKPTAQDVLDTVDLWASFGWPLSPTASVADGPGRTAFDVAASALGLAPSTVQSRYYKARGKAMGSGDTGNT